MDQEIDIFDIDLDNAKELDSSEFIALVQSMQDKTYEEDNEDTK